MRRRGWQVRRRRAVQRLHAEYLDLQRQRAAGLWRERPIHRATCLHRGNAQLRSFHGKVRAVRVGGSVSCVGQRMSQRCMHDKYLWIRTETPGNRLQRRHLQRDRRVPGVQSRKQGVQRQRRSELQQQRAVRPDRELRGTEALLRRDDHKLRVLHVGVSVYDAREHLFAGDVQRKRVRDCEQGGRYGMHARNGGGNVYGGELPGVYDERDAVQERGDEHGADLRC